jgi:hypothetical protein
VDRCKLRFRFGGKKALFKLCLEVEIWFWKGFLEGPETVLECFASERH